MRGAALLAVLVLAGCGGGGRPPAQAKPPHIPRALALTWESQANAVAQALAAGDGCTALREASALRDSVSRSQSRVPRRLRPTLAAVVVQLPGRITCNPPAPAPEKLHPPHGDGHGHGHGHDQGDNG